MAKKQKKGPHLDLSNLYAAIMDEAAEKSGGDSGLDDSVASCSTGMLAYDIVYGGGLRPAWYTHLGKEQSAKTTGALTIVAGALKDGVPIIRIEDYEGSTKNSTSYVASIFHGAGVKLPIREIFGKKDPKTGKWNIEPRVRYRSESVAERFFDRLHALLKRLPDKKLFEDKWYLIFPDDKKFAHLKEHSDTAMARKYGKGIYIPAEDGNLQALLVVDSYPAMNPESNDEEDTNDSLALQARMFSKQFPRVKGRMGQKMVAVIGVNQLRTAPMVRYGPPDYEPGGEALRFNSDVRVRHDARAISGVDIRPKPKEDPENKATEREASCEFEGATDVYRYVKIKAIKNKLWTPQRTAWLRIWVEDGSGKARGLDPVFDTWQYLFTTGQADGKNKRVLNLNLEGFGAGKKSITWLDFKKWVLGNKEDKIAVCKRLGYTPLDIRKFCFRQMKNGEGESLYVDHQNAKRKKGKEEDDD